MNDVEIATGSLERHQHLQEAPEDAHGRRIALLIGVLAAVLALSEMAERSAQNFYLARYIAASDDYAFYQARQTRALLLTQTATLLGDLAPSNPAAAKHAAEAQEAARRLTEDSERGNGLSQIQGRAEQAGRERDIALRRYEWFELVTSALQIAIVLASVSVVTHWRPVAYVGAAIGGAAAVLAGLVGVGAV